MKLNKPKNFEKKLNSCLTVHYLHEISTDKSFTNVDIVVFRSEFCGSAFEIKAIHNTRKLKIQFIKLNPIILQKKKKHHNSKYAPVGAHCRHFSSSGN